MSRNSFTIIELIIVISIIGVLAAIGIGSYSNVTRNARNAQRKSDAKDLKTALEAYKNDNGFYPSTLVGGVRQWRGACSNYGSHPDSGATAYIPDISPNYLDRLPHDPRESQPIPNHIRPSCQTGTSNCYIYSSDGINFKLLVHCTPEGTMSTNDPFYDPQRTLHAWQVSSNYSITSTW